MAKTVSEVKNEIIGHINYALDQTMGRLSKKYKESDMIDAFDLMKVFQAFKTDLNESIKGETPANTPV